MHHKYLLLLLLILGLKIAGNSQYLRGSYYDLHGDRYDGLILQYPDTSRVFLETDRIYFRASSRAPYEKISADEILGFTIEQDTFATLTNADLGHEDYKEDKRFIVQVMATGKLTLYTFHTNTHAGGSSFSNGNEGLSFELVQQTQINYIKKGHEITRIYRNEEIENTLPELIKDNQHTKERLQKEGFDITKDLKDLIVFYNNRFPDYNDDEYLSKAYLVLYRKEKGEIPEPISIRIGNRKMTIPTLFQTKIEVESGVPVEIENEAGDDCLVVIPDTYQTTYIEISDTERNRKHLEKYATQHAKRVEKGKLAKKWKNDPKKRAKQLAKYANQIEKGKSNEVPPYFPTLRKVSEEEGAYFTEQIILEKE